MLDYLKMTSEVMEIIELNVSLPRFTYSLSHFSFTNTVMLRDSFCTHFSRSKDENMIDFECSTPLNALNALPEIQSIIWSTVPVKVLSSFFLLFHTENM